MATNYGQYFKEKEFWQQHKKSDGEEMNQQFVDFLNDLREYIGEPLFINSGFRSKTWELANNRSGNSAHTKGLAVDINTNSSSSFRFKLVAAALYFGIKRIGIGRTYVHLDMDKTLPQNVMWDYYK